MTSSFVEKLEKESGYLEFQQEVDLKRQELLKSKQAEKQEQIHSAEVDKERPQREDKQKDGDMPPKYNTLQYILKQYRVTMPIKEMADQSRCCIKFLQELLKINADLSKEELIPLTSFFKVKLQDHVPLTTIHSIHK